MEQHIGTREEIIHETVMGENEPLVWCSRQHGSVQEEIFMSSWWGGYYGSGLVLNQGEFDGFLVAYKEWNHIDGDKDLFSEEPMSEFSFIRSIHAGEYFSGSEVKPEDSFGIEAVLQEECDGMRFIPYMNREEKNLCMRDGTLTPDYSSCDRRGEDLYVIWSDKEFDSVQAFEEKPYASYEEFRNEFIEKAQRYLPEDFDWDSHLGRLTYAVFA